jgi:hypothetical protein
MLHMGVFFAEGMCFDTTMEGNGGPSGGVPIECEGQCGLALRHRTGAVRDVYFREYLFHAVSILENGRGRRLGPA